MVFLPVEHHYIPSWLRTVPINNVSRLRPRASWCQNESLTVRRHLCSRRRIAWLWQNGLISFATSWTMNTISAGRVYKSILISLISRPKLLNATIRYLYLNMNSRETQSVIKINFWSDTFFLSNGRKIAIIFGRQFILAALCHLRKKNYLDDLFWRKEKKKKYFYKKKRKKNLFLKTLSIITTLLRVFQIFLIIKLLLLRYKQILIFIVVECAIFLFSDRFFHGVSHSWKYRAKL